MNIKKNQFLIQWNQSGCNQSSTLFLIIFQKKGLEAISHKKVQGPTGVSK